MDSATLGRKKGVGRRAVSMPSSATRPTFPTDAAIPEHPFPTADGEENIFTHSNGRIVSFQVSGDKPPYPWRSPGEQLLSAGVIRIHRAGPLGLIFMKSGSRVSRPLLPSSKAWEVDKGIFCFRVMGKTYWRVEILESSGSSEKAEEFRKVLEDVLSFEVERCPFRRGDCPDLTDDDTTSEASTDSVAASKRIVVRKRFNSLSHPNGRVPDLPSFFRQSEKPLWRPSDYRREYGHRHKRSISVAPDFAKPVVIREEGSPSPPYVTPEEIPPESMSTLLQQRDKDASNPYFPETTQSQSQLLTPPPSLSRGRKPRPALTPLTITLPPSPSQSSSTPTTPTLLHTSDFDLSTCTSGFSPTTTPSDKRTPFSPWSPSARPHDIKHLPSTSTHLITRTAGLLATTVIRPSLSLAHHMLGIAGKIALTAIEAGTGAGEMETEMGVGEYRGFPGGWKESFDELGYYGEDDYGMDLRRG